MAVASGSMNFLAHIYLSGSDPDILRGNFIGDGVKGRQALDFAPEIQAGIALHRFIDDYTDSHPRTADARRLIRPEFRKYAGVVLDVYFDHFLGVNWEEYHPQNLETFVEEVHTTLEPFHGQMPDRSARFYTYMRANNWLVNYRQLSELDVVFHGMSRRAQFDSNMENAVPVLRANYEELSKVFAEFFPQLSEAAEAFRTSDFPGINR